jgi:hypothetical protein
MKVNTCFNLKFSKRIYVFGEYMCGVNDCIEWMKEKRLECANIRKYKKMITAGYVAAGSEPPQY